MFGPVTCTWAEDAAGKPLRLTVNPPVVEAAAPTVTVAVRVAAAVPDAPLAVRVNTYCCWAVVVFAGTAMEYEGLRLLQFTPVGRLLKEGLLVTEQVGALRALQLSCTLPPELPRAWGLVVKLAMEGAVAGAD